MPGKLDRLETFDGEGAVRVVVEASAGTRSKFKYDPALGVFALHHVIPPGTAFPLDFGILPSTVGAVAPARLLGVIEAKQAKAGDRPARNDRFIAAATASHSYDAWKDMRDVPPKLVEAIDAFFVTYNAQRGVRFEPAGRHGASAAAKLLREGQERRGNR